MDDMEPEDNFEEPEPEQFFDPDVSEYSDSEERLALESTLSKNLLVPKTQKQYNVQLKKFAEFCNHPWLADVDLPRELFTDHRVAGFLHDLGVKTEFVPHTKKAAVAALNIMVKKYGLPSLTCYDQHVRWPMTYRAIEQWKTYLKQNVYHPIQTGYFTNEAIQAIYELNCTTPQDHQKKACACVFITTGMRGHDLRYIRSCTVKVIPGSKTYSRHISMLMDRMKTDPHGDLPDSKRTIRVPCHCLELLGNDENAIRTFKRRMRDDPQCHCCKACPFEAVLSYLQLCPDPFGSINEEKRKSNQMLKPLYFMRSLTTRGDRTLTENPLGENCIKNCLYEINDLLPRHLRCERITGHSARRTFVTSSLNAGVDATVVSMTSKHKNLEQLRRYASPDPHTMMSSALAIRKVAAGTKEDIFNERNNNYYDNNHISSSPKNIKPNSDADNVFHPDSMKNFHFYFK